MIGWIVFGCIVLLVLLIPFIRLRLTLEYKDEVRLFLKILCFRIKILPRKPKAKKGPHSMSKKKAEKIREDLRQRAEKKREKELAKKKKKKEKQGDKKKPSKDGKKLSLSDIFDIVEMARDVLITMFERSFGHLRVDVARLHINLCLDDPAKTAIAYGAVTQAAMYLFDVLDKFKGINMPKVKDLSINADFLGERTTVDMKISASFRLWHFAHIFAAVLARSLKHVFKYFDKKNENDNSKDDVHKPQRLNIKTNTQK